MTTLLIDNYDSFTYNVYQYLSIHGADVVVYRNDKITIEEIETLSPVNIVISPGPGHPSQDAGISREVISHFSGRIPILGICMGEQCIFEVFGGTVSYAGDVLHGKTSHIKHDGCGIFKNIPQNNQVTRYHSLAGVPKSLPSSLQVTATTDEGVIMAIRHKEYTVEGVQFHPESILCHHGQNMIANFLSLRGGTWDANPAAGILAEKTVSNEAKPAQAPSNHTATNSGTPSILNRIYAQRIKDVQAAKETPGQTQEDLEKLLSLYEAPPLRDVVSRIRETDLALMAEVKRASPSKGNIDIKANAAHQALQYALAGASVISVLTEPKWFRGTLSDMRQVRKAVDILPNRPCILRKDFIVDPYQILEARLYGADTILLIVAMLSDKNLKELYQYSLSLGMEPLVEVNNAEQMARANAIGARLVGVNNRNLHNFDVDMETTSRLAEMVPKGTILCALSGISSRADVEVYVSQGVRGILVGEALMRAWDLKQFVAELLGHEKKAPSPAISGTRHVQVKICGISSVEAAVEAAKAGADMIGLIFAEKSKRKVSLDTAKAIIDTVRAVPTLHPTTTGAGVTSVDWFDVQAELLEQRPRKPLVVGVFVNQSIEYMLHIASEAGLDLIQLHGTESSELARFLPVPVIKAFHMDAESFHKRQIPYLTQPGNNHFVLLDAKVAGISATSQGGHGQTFDWSIAKEVVDHRQTDHSSGKPFPILLAGGLDPTNVATAVQQVRPWAVDVSSGVETEGVKDLDKIRAFVENAKAIRL
ncbi:N-anthranilate isomerase [Spinellus fusiger]|nr:N-anthranilate isomerase [Spinellus fusiger]